MRMITVWAVLALLVAGSLLAPESSVARPGAVETLALEPTLDATPGTVPGTIPLPLAYRVLMPMVAGSAGDTE